MSELTVFQNSSAELSSVITNPATQTLFNFLILALTVIIARQQNSTNRYKIKMDLYEKRFRVYHMTRDILHSTLSSADINHDQFRALDDCIAESKFIFKPDIHKHLHYLRTKLQTIHDKRVVDDPKYKTKILSEDEEFILTEIRNLPVIFSEYLSLQKF